jgi:hypothetical protein
MLGFGLKKFPLMNFVVLDDSRGTRPQPFGRLGQRPPCDKRTLTQVTNIVNALQDAASSSPATDEAALPRGHDQLLEIGEQESRAVFNILTSLPLDIKASLVDSTYVPDLATFCLDAAHNKHISPTN